MTRAQIREVPRLPPSVLIDSIRGLDVQQAPRIVNPDPWAFALMTVVSTLNPSVASLEGWGRYFPQNTTTVTESFERNSERSLVNMAVMVTTSERIRDALRLLGLTKTQLKEICAVSRQTLYDWLSGSFEPDTANAARLRAIHELALLVPRNSRLPIRAALLTQPISGEESLLDMLRKPTLNMRRLREAVAALASRSGMHEKRSASALRERLGFRKLEKASQTANLDENTEDLETK